MKLSILLLLTVCWVNAAPKHKSHRNLPRIGANSNKHGLYSIVGSKTCSIKKYPYTAAVLTTSNMLLGGASIYNKKWILTAGWNTYGESVSTLEVRVGSDNALKGGQLIKLSKMVPHPNYTAENWDWDVALLKLKKNIKFNKKTKAIKVSDTLPKNKSTGVITGWGSRNYLSQNLDSDKLQELTIDIYDRNTCIKKWWDNESVNPRSYCAFKPGCGPCSSDFGDPLVQNGKVVGMYLGGYGCAVDYYPGLFSALAKFYDWIVATVKKYSDPADLDDSDVQYYGEDDDDEEDDEAEEEEWENEEAEEEEEEEGANDDDLRNKEDNDAKIVGADAIGVA